MSIKAPTRRFTESLLPLSVAIPVYRRWLGAHWVLVKSIVQLVSHVLPPSLRRDSLRIHSRTGGDV